MTEEQTGGETSLKEKESLGQGRYEERIDWPPGFPPSKEMWVEMCRRELTVQFRSLLVFRECVTVSGEKRRRKRIVLCVVGLIGVKSPPLSVS